MLHSCGFNVIGAYMLFTNLATMRQIIIQYKIAECLYCGSLPDFPDRIFRKLPINIGCVKATRCDTPVGPEIHTGKRGFADALFRWIFK
jgi:hypothetical protein